VTSLMLSFVLSVTQCYANDYKKTPVYCQCLESARTQYEICLESNKREKCYHKKDRAQYECSKYKGK
jgi:hypothetical protein